MSTSVVRNSALVPVPAADRPFGWRDHASLWLSLGVGLLVMQVGSFLVPAMGRRRLLRRRRRPQPRARRQRATPGRDDGGAVHRARAGAADARPRAVPADAVVARRAAVRHDPPPPGQGARRRLASRREGGRLGRGGDLDRGRRAAERGGHTRSRAPGQYRIEIASLAVCPPATAKRLASKVGAVIRGNTLLLAPTPSVGIPSRLVSASSLPLVSCTTAIA